MLLTATLLGLLSTLQFARSQVRYNGFVLANFFFVLLVSLLIVNFKIESIL